MNRLRLSLTMAGAIGLATFAATGHAGDIETRRVEEREHKTEQRFCAKTSEKDAETKCRDWLAEQKKSLGDRLLTSHCTDGELGDIKGCLYRSVGTVTFVLKSEREEIRRRD